jgi:hypothetical protein
MSICAEVKQQWKRREASDIADAPDAPGVIVIFDGNGELWAVQPAASLATRLEELRTHPTYKAGYAQYASKQCTNIDEATKLFRQIFDECEPRGQFENFNL